MSRTDADELERDVVRSRSQEYNKLKEQYINDEISEQEFSRQAEDLLLDGEDFLEYEDTAAVKMKDTGRSIKQNIAYYSLPLTIIAAFAVPVLLPNVSPMIAVVAAPTILTVAVIIWGYFRIRSATRTQ